MFESLDVSGQLGLVLEIMVALWLIGLNWLKLPKTKLGTLIAVGCLIVSQFLIVAGLKTSGVPLSNVKSLHGIYAVEGTLATVGNGKYICVQPITIREEDLTAKAVGKRVFAEWVYGETPPPFVFFDGQGGWQRHRLSDLPAGMTNLAPAIIPAIPLTAVTPESTNAPPK